MLITFSCFEAQSFYADRQGQILERIQYFIIILVWKSYFPFTQKVEKFDPHHMQ